MVDQIITRQEAIKQDLVHYFTGEACIHGHIVSRHVSDKNCITCKQLRSKMWKIKNSDRVKETRNKWQDANRDKVNYQQKLWRVVNPEKQSLYVRNWRQNNKSIVRALKALYRANKLRATPQWADLKSIQMVYDLCPSDYEVDHIVPLDPRSKLVCGLHVHWNLQILHKDKHKYKVDYYWPDMW